MARGQPRDALEQTCRPQRLCVARQHYECDELFSHQPYCVGRNDRARITSIFASNREYDARNITRTRRLHYFTDQRLITGRGWVVESNRIGERSNKLEELARLKHAALTALERRGYNVRGRHKLEKCRNDARRSLPSLVTNRRCGASIRHLR